MPSIMEPGQTIVAGAISTMRHSRPSSINWAGRLTSSSRPILSPGGLLSLRLSLCWLPHLLVRTKLVLIPVQDGMEPADLVRVVLPKRIGIFLGGSTEWKLETMQRWGEFCARHGVHYHVGRVNTLKRFRLAHMAGADSVDGSSASRYAVTLPKLDFASRQWDMWAPPRNREAQLAWAASPAEVVL